MHHIPPSKIVGGMYGPASTTANETTKRNDGHRRPRSNIDPLVLGAILNTTCIRCGGSGHISSECFVRQGEKKYELLSDYDDVMDAISSSSMPASRYQPTAPPPSAVAAVGRGRGAVLPSWLQDQGNSSSSSRSSKSRPRDDFSGQDMMDRGVGRGRGAVVPAWMTHDGESFGNRSSSLLTDEKEKDSKKHKKKEKKEHKKHHHHHKEKKKKHKSKEDKKKKKRRHEDDERDDDHASEHTDGLMHKRQKRSPTDDDSSSSSSSDDD